MCKPTMQDIADALSTSRVSVWKVLNNRPGVSDLLRHQIWEKARELGYLPPESTTSFVPETVHRRSVAVAVCRPESSLFWMKIIHQMAKDLSSLGVNLMYTYLPTSWKEGYSLPSSLYDGSVEGVVVLNVYSPPILQLLADLPMPKVYLDTIPSLPFGKLDGDLLLIEGRGPIREITGRLCLTGSLGLRTHYEEISQFLENLPSLPDGFVCVSDYIAHFIQRYFEEHGSDPEGRIVLTGFDNNAEYLNVAKRITTVDVRPKTLGARLASKILFLLEHPGVAQEISYVRSDILFRGTLTEQA